MANGKFLDLLNAIRDLFEGLGSSTSTDDVPLVGNTQAPTPKFGRRGYGRQEKKDHMKGKIGDMTLEADGNDAPGMFQSGANTMTGFYMGRKGIDFAFKTLEMQRDKELKRGENPGGGNDGGNGAGNGNDSSNGGDNNELPKKTKKVPWPKWFHRKFPFPTKLPPTLAPFLKNCPDGCKDAIFFHLLAMIGALSVPMVRALYLDGRNHAPTMQLVSVGDSGTGKSIIGDLIKRIYGRVKVTDEEKINAINSKPKDPDNPGVRRIFQIVGFNISETVLHQILNNNDGVAAYIVEPEISTLLEARRKGNGLTPEQLRKAHDGEITHRLTRARGGSSAPVCTLRLTLAVTGTPGEALAFRNSPLGSMEGGNASRIIWCEHAERIEKPSLVIPEEEKLSDIRTELLELRKKYCYTTDDNDEDTPCPEHYINLRYVSEALEDWIAEQREIATETGDYCRDGYVWRMASIAFNCAITLHMLFGEPTSTNRTARKAVIDATIYIANYCIERYIKMFGADENKIRKEHMESEMVTVEVDEDDVDEEEMSEEELAAKIIEEYQPGVTGHGWDSVAVKLGIPVDRVRYLHGKYTKKNGDRSSGV